MDEKFCDLPSQVRVLGFGEEKHFGVDPLAAGRRVTASRRALVDAPAVVLRRRTVHGRLEAGPAEHAAR